MKNHYPAIVPVSWKPNHVSKFVFVLLLTALPTLIVVAEKVLTVADVF